jgi:hypothetical protein
VAPAGDRNPDIIRNPTLYLASNQFQLALVLANAIKRDGQRLTLGAGGTGDFTVDNAAEDNQYQNLTPELIITADGSDPGSAQRSVNTLAWQGRAVVERLQREANVPSENEVWIIASVEPEAGERLPTNRARRGGAYTVATLLLGVLLILLFDAFLECTRRRKPRQAQRGSAADDIRASRPADTRREARSDPGLTQRSRRRAGVGSDAGRHTAPGISLKYDSAPPTTPLQLDQPVTTHPAPP